MLFFISFLFVLYKHLQSLQWTLIRFSFALISCSVSRNVTAGRVQATGTVLAEEEALIISPAARVLSTIFEKLPLSTRVQFSSFVRSNLAGLLRGKPSSLLKSFASEQLQEQYAHSDLVLILLEKFSFVNSIFCSSFPSFSSFSFSSSSSSFFSFSSLSSLSAIQSSIFSSSLTVSSFLNSTPLTAGHEKTYLPCLPPAP